MTYCFAGSARALVVVLCAIALPAALGAASGIVYDSGPLATGVRDGCLGFDSSRKQNLTFPGLISFGMDCTYTQSNHVADDFTLAQETTITGFTFYVAPRNSSQTCAIDEARIAIWNGVPGEPGSSIVFGGLDTDRFGFCEFAGYYRDAQSDPGDCDLPVMAVTANAATTLAAGTYWVEWALDMPVSEPIYAQFTTRAGANSSCTGTCNARVWSFGGWQALTDDSVPQGLKFTVNSAVPRTIRSGNATLHRDSTPYDVTPDAAFKGVTHQPTVDQLFGLGWAYRVSGDSREFYLGTPTNETFGSNSSSANWTDVGGRGLFSASESVYLTSTGMGAYALMQLMVTNLSASNPLTIELFHHLDVDLTSAGSNSAKKAEWTPARIIRISDQAGNSADYLTTDDTDRFLVAALGSGSVESLLEDADLDDFDGSGLPFSLGDVTAGYQVQRVVPPSGSMGMVVIVAINSPQQCDGFPNGLHCDGFESNDFQPWSSSMP